MKHSLRARLVVIFTLLVSATIMICVCLNIFLLPAYYQKTKISQMDKIYQRLVLTCQNIDWSDKSSTLYEEAVDSIDRISANSSVNVYIMTVNINTADNSWWPDYKYPTMSNHQRDVYKNRLEKYVQARLSGERLGENYQLIKRQSEYDIYRVYDERIGSYYTELVGDLSNQNNSGVWVYLRSNYQSIKESAKVSNELLAYVGMGAIVMGFLVIYFISTQYTKPILRLAINAKKLSELDFSAKYTETRFDEIGVLGDSMNTLSEKLEHTISELKTANNELQKDIAKKEEQEQMRSEFVANVSHELKTPIALIQGYAEGLQDNINDDPESREFYCEVIIDEANKMNNLVKNLLSLNQLEFGNNQLEFQRFDIGELIHNVLQSYEIFASENNIQVSFHKEEISVWADEYMIEHVVSNYISNAFHYVKNDPDGKRIIEVKTVRKNDVARVSVFNSGDAIPEDDISHIWDKFYKVDKARTREYGGNGIGLSIVKAVMESHNQKYGVLNYNNGVEFWFEIMV